MNMNPFHKNSTDFSASTVFCQISSEQYHSPIFEMVSPHKMPVFLLPKTAPDIQMHFKQISRLGHFFSKVPNQTFPNRLRKDCSSRKEAAQGPVVPLGGKNLEKFFGWIFTFLCVFFLGGTCFFFKLDGKTAMYRQGGGF